MDLGETVGKILIFCNVPQHTTQQLHAWQEKLTRCVSAAVTKEVDRDATEVLISKVRASAFSLMQQVPAARA